MTFDRKLVVLIPAVLLLSLLVACGDSPRQVSAPPTPPPTPPAVTAVSITPKTATGRTGSSLQFTVAVQGTGTFDHSVTWLVNDVPGGSAALGMISKAGLYVGPDTVPYPNQLVVKAVSVADKSKIDSAQLTVVEVPFRPPSTYYPTHDLISATIDGQSMEVAKGEVLVYLKADATSAELSGIQTAISNVGGAMVGSSVDTRTIQVAIPDSGSLQSTIDQLRKVPGVRTASANFTVGLLQDNRAGYRNYLQRRSKSGLTLPRLRAARPMSAEVDPLYWMQHIHADQAWALTTGSAADEAVLGIVDSGIESDQKIVSSDRITRFSGTGAKLADDDTKEADKGYHGRWVTGLAAGYQDNPDSVVRGLAQQNRVIMTDVVHLVSDTCVTNFQGLKVPCSRMPTIAEVSQAVVTTMKQGAKIINLSLGPKGIACADDPATDFNEADPQRHIALHQGFRDALTNTLEAVKRNDSLLVVAAGNECEKNDNQQLPNATQKDAAVWSTHALRVTASDATDVPAAFANTGSAVDLAAPGDQISFWSGDGSIGKLEQELNLKADSGSSYSAPLVTGAAGLLRSVSPTLYAPEMRYILLNTSEKMPVPAPPNLLLNVGRAVSDAMATSSLAPQVLSPVSISGGETKNLTFDVTVPATTAKALDIVFLIDTTGSYGDDIENLKASAQTIIDNLSTRGLDIQFGVTSFADFPFEPFGDVSCDDRGFYLNQPVTADTAAVKNAINNLDNPLHCGNDGKESQLEGLFQAAAGSGRDLNADGNYADLGEILPSNIGWRTGSLKVVIISTDAPFHDAEVESDYPVAGNGTVPGFSAVITALKAKGITVVGLNSGSSSTDLQRLVDGVGGIVLDLSSGGSDIAEKIAEGIDAKLKQVTLTVDTITGGEWISSIDPPSYDAVKPGETRTFTVNLVSQKRNAIWDQSYDLILWVRADASAILERVRIPIMVPRK